MENQKLLILSELGNSLSYSYVIKDLKNILEERFDCFYFCIRNLGNDRCRRRLKEYNFVLETTNGVMPINQDENNKNLLLKIILPMDIWRFSVFVKATTLTGSAILALAFVNKQLEAEELFSLCFLDELYQIKRWGEDEEALQKRSAIKNELFSISDFLRLTEI